MTNFDAWARRQKKDKHPCLLTFAQKMLVKQNGCKESCVAKKYNCGGRYHSTMCVNAWERYGQAEKEAKNG